MGIGHGGSKEEEKRWSKGGSGDQERKCRSYMRRMSKEGEWVDHLMVVAMANAFGRKI